MRREVEVCGVAVQPQLQAGKNSTAWEMKLGEVVKNVRPVTWDQQTFGQLSSLLLGHRCPTEQALKPHTWAKVGAHNSRCYCPEDGSKN